MLGEESLSTMRGKGTRMDILLSMFRNRFEKYCSTEGSHTKSYRFRINIPSTTEKCSSSGVKKSSVNAVPY